MSPTLKPLVGNQAKLLKALVYMLFERRFLSTITWSGKSKGPKKTALQSYENVYGMMFDTVVAIDRSYKYDDFLSNLKNKILKYAYE